MHDADDAVEPILFHCQDPERNQVILTVTRWVDHILPSHPDLFGAVESVRMCIARPDVVTYDRGYDDRKCFYRRVVINESHGLELLKIVIHYSDNAYGESEGTVVTAFPIDFIHPDEEPL